MLVLVTTTGSRRVREQEVLSLENQRFDFSKQCYFHKLVLMHILLNLVLLYSSQRASTLNDATDPEIRVTCDISITMNVTKAYVGLTTYLQA